MRCSFRRVIMRFTDIGSNLGDPVFRGKYHGNQKHPDDFGNVMERAKAAGVVRQILTADCYNETKKVVDLASKYHDSLYTTAGCHPCRSKEVAEHPNGLAGYMSDLDKLISVHKNKQIVAVGECGLDYDRLFLSPKEDQLAVFPPHIELANKHNLPMFLHVRTTESHIDFVNIIKKYGPINKGGVVHSFTGTLQEAQEYISLGLDIGINGCSLKTQENLNVVKEIPLQNIHLESDCPWCEIRPTHASYPYLKTIEEKLLSSSSSNPYRPAQVKKEKWDANKMVKGRNEPFSTALVAFVLAAIKNVQVEQVAQQTWMNSSRIFSLPEATE